MTLPLEVGHNEIGDADNPDMVESPEATKILTELGFPKPAPVPCMKLEHQIAQKLHGVSSAHSQRAHDLVDLQIIVNSGNVDYKTTRKTCERLFAYRKEQAWPPSIIKGENWEALYVAQSEGLDVLKTVDEAIAWANKLIKSITGAIA